MKPVHKTRIDDVAEYAGVSIKTVSRVVNREPNVREATRKKVNDAIEALNYQPDPSARNLASQRSRFIGLIYEDPSAYEAPSAGFITRMQEGALRACREAGYELLIHPCNFRSKNVTAELKELIKQARPAGMIVAAPLSNIPRIVRVIEDSRTPFVRMAPGTKISKHLTVATNDREVCAEMTHYLATLGHRRIAFITGDPSHKAVARRFLGFQDGLQESGIRFAKKWVAEGDNSIGSGEIAAHKLLRRKQRPTAIFAANDDMAAGVLRVAAQLGLKVPEELSVAGCDDSPLAQFLYPSLTTIRQPLAAMAEWSAQTLIDVSIQRAARYRAEVIASELHIRESTGPAPKT